MYKVLIGWLALGWFVAGSANATDEIVIADVRACAAIVDPVARLQCFDLLAGKYGLDTATATEDGSTGAWSVTEDKSPLGDTKTMVTLLASTDVTGGKGIGNPSAALGIRCAEGKLDLFLGTSEFMGLHENREVLIRLGADVAKKDTWSVSSNGKGVGLWGGARPAVLVNRLMESDNPSLVIRSDIYAGPPLTARFDLTGAKQALGPIFSLCTAETHPRKKALTK